MENERKLITKALTEDKVNLALQAWYKIPTKLSKESVQARQEGNKLFTRGSHSAQIHEQIWKYYSESIAKAPFASEDLAVAYANRSALLIHIRKYRESICDIDKALQITQNNSLKVKLLCRKTECFTALQIGKNETILKKAKYWFSKVEDEKDKEILIRMLDRVSDYVKKCNSIISEEEFSKKCSLISNPSTIQKKNKLTIQKALVEKEHADPFELACLRYSEKFGRHLVANRDIKPGEIIMVVKPYITTLNQNNFHAFCGHCLKTCWTNIPCDYCNWCMFCTEECKNEAWEKYHDIECAVMPYIRFDETADYLKQLALRMTIISIKEAGSIENLKNELKEIDNCKNKLHKGFTDGKSCSNSYQSVYSLCHNVSTDSLLAHIDHAALTLIFLAKSTTLFGESIKFRTGNDLLANEDVVFVGTLLLKFLKISDLNAHVVMEGNSVCRFSNSIKQCEINRCCERGSCIAVVPSFMNHSCYPNVRKVFTEDMQLVIYSLQPIKKDSQLFDCYAGTYFDKPLEERRLSMKEFNFICSCPPCENNWSAVLSINNQLNQNSANVSFKSNKKFLYKDHTKNEKMLEIEILERNSDLIVGRTEKQYSYSLSDVEKLSIDIEVAAKYLSQPSYATATLISTLWCVFDSVYGIKLCVPDACN